MTAHLDLDAIIDACNAELAIKGHGSVVRRASSRHKPHLEVWVGSTPLFELRPTTGRWDHVSEDLERGRRQAPDTTVGVVRPVSSRKPELLVTLSLEDLLGLIM